MHNRRFTFLCTSDELAALQRLAAKWKRSKGDVVRLLISDALSRLFTDGPQQAVQTANSAAEIAAETEVSHDGHAH